MLFEEIKFLDIESSLFRDTISYAFLNQVSSILSFHIELNRSSNKYSRYWLIPISNIQRTIIEAFNNEHIKGTRSSLSNFSPPPQTFARGHVRTWNASIRRSHVKLHQADNGLDTCIFLTCACVSPNPLQWTINHPHWEAC